MNWLKSIVNLVVDTAIEAPGAIAKASTEIATRAVVEAPIRIVGGVVEGAQKAVEKIDEAVTEIDRHV